MHVHDGVEIQPSESARNTEGHLLADAGVGKFAKNAQSLASKGLNDRRWNNAVTRYSHALAMRRIEDKVSKKRSYSRWHEAI